MCPELPIISNAPSSQARLTRREMFQRILAGLGTGLAGPVAAQAHPMYRHLMDATTLEGQTPTPPGHGNFTTPPSVYRGPYEYSVPGHARDFTPQNQAD